MRCLKTSVESEDSMVRAVILIGILLSVLPLLRGVHIVSTRGGMPMPTCVFLMVVSSVGLLVMVCGSIARMP